jgi:hypothetical protein
MNCEQAKEQIVDRWITGLGEDKRIELDQHTANCVSCREESDALQALWNGLGDLPLEEPSRALRANFYQMIEAYRLGLQSGAGVVQKPSPVEAGREWLKRLWPRNPLLQLATAGLALVFGLVAGHLYTTRGHDQERIAQLSTEMQHMRQLVALSLLQQQSASDRLQGVSYSVRMEPADEEVLSALVDTLNHDGNVNVRLAAVDALKQFSARPNVRQGLRRALLRQDSPLVQISLIDWAVEAKDRGSLDMLRKLKQQSELHPSVQSRLARAIDGLQ